MAQLRSELREAYESAGHDVAEVSENRERVRVVLLEELGAEDARSILADVVGDDALGVNVTTESVDGHEGVNTVVSFRDRP